MFKGMLLPTLAMDCVGSIPDAEELSASYGICANPASLRNW
jgi:hypothetical protein